MSISDYTSSDEEFIENEPALHRAVREADVVGLSALLESASYNDINRFYKYKYTKYLSKCCDIYFFDEKITPLMLAAELGHTECAQALLNHGADVNLAYHGYDITDLDDSALHYAIREGHTECALLLLAAGADVTAATERGTPLHYAVYHDNVELASVLLEEYGANVNSRSESCGRTPLFVAVSNNATRCARLLLDYGADVHARDDSKQTVIFAARDGEGLDAAKIVLDAGASIYVWDVNGDTPLHSAVDRDHPKLSILLLQRGMSLRVLQRSAYLGDNATQKTPLAFAIREIRLAHGLAKSDSNAANCISNLYDRWGVKTAANVAAWVIQRAWREYIRTRAAYRIQAAWRQTYCNPIYMVCRRRLEREFAELNNA